MTSNLSQEDLTITLDDLKSYAVGGRDNKVYKIWGKLLESLPTGEREQIEAKGFELVDDPAIKNTSKERYFQLKVNSVDDSVKIRCAVR